jgi:hypothetical protein
VQAGELLLRVGIPHGIVGMQIAWESFLDGF